MCSMLMPSAAVISENICTSQVEPTTILIVKRSIRKTSTTMTVATSSVFW